MRLDTFFEKFEILADTPGAVAKIRELVLELAVQGRLAAPLPADDTVPSKSDFRENVTALAKSLGLRSPKEPLDEVESLFDIPAHWRWMALADLGAAQTGTTPRKADEDAFNGDVPFIKPADILPGSINYFNESLTRRGAETGSRLAPSGSLLMVCIGTIGKCNLIERECAFNQQINSVTPVVALDSRYLLVAGRSRYFQNAAWKKSSSTTIPILNKGKWLSIPVPVPPVAEQKRIVGRVDELMALCDRLEAQQQEREVRHVALVHASLTRFADAPTLANLDLLFHKSYSILPADLKKSILKLAVQGHLKSSSSDLGFPQVRLDSLGAWAQGCGFPIVEQGHADREILFSKVSDMNLPGNEREILNTIHTIDEATAKRLRIKVHPPGTVIFPKIGGAIATNKRRVLVQSTAIDNNCSGIIPNESCSTSWVFLVLSAIDFANYQSGTSVPAVNQGTLGEIIVSLPPLAEQHRIVARVDGLIALVDALEAQFGIAGASGENLLKAVVAELTAEA